MLIPIRTDSPLRHTPYMNWLIIVANVIVFVAQGFNHSLEARYGLSPRSPQLVQFFTYQFLHANPAHIGGNMLFLYIFGNNVNDKMGHLGYLAFYLAGGIFAGVCYVLTQHSAAGVIGASGAIAAVTGAYLILFPRSNVTLIYFFFLIGYFELQSLWFILLFFAMDVFMSGTGDSVAHMAHIGGTIFGTSICLVLLIAQLLPRDQFDVWALLQRWNKRRQYRDLVSKGFNPFEATPAVRGKRALPDPVMERVHELRGQISDALSNRDNAAAAKLYVQLKAVDPAQVLSRQGQLDVATQLHHEGLYEQAAEAYEGLLKTYPNVERVEQVELMVGLIYARYLNKFEQAKQHLSKAIARLHGGRELELAQEELSRVQVQLGAAR
jgi:membrane associated rhomboid family serine protease